MGIGPTSHPWEGRILPVNYTRNVQIHYIRVSFIPTSSLFGSRITF